MFVKNCELNANSVDHDQTPRSAASDLVLHCLPMSHLWDARLKWVNVLFFTILADDILTYVSDFFFL